MYTVLCILYYVYCSMYTVQCVVCLCLASITAVAGAPLWYILRLTHIQPQHANSYIYSFPCTRILQMCGEIHMRTIYKSCQVIHLFFFAQSTHQHQYHYLSPLIERVTSWSKALCHWVSSSAKKQWIKALNMAGRHKKTFIREHDLKVILKRA